MSVVLPAVVLVVSWWMRQSSAGEQTLLQFLIGYYSTDFIPTFYRRGALLVYDNYSLFEGFPGYVLACVFSLVAIVPVLWSVIRDAGSAVRSLTSQNTSALLALLVCAAACFFLLPNGLPYQYYLYQRFGVLVILSLAAAGSLLVAKKLRIGFKCILVVIALLHFSLYAEYLTAFDSENRTFDKELFASADVGSRLVGLIFDGEYQGRDTYIHFPNYFIVWNHGIAASCIIEYRFSLIRRKVPPEVLAPYEEYITEGGFPVESYRQMDFVLVRGEPSEDGKRFLGVFQKRVSRGIWSLYGKQMYSSIVDFTPIR